MSNGIYLIQDGELVKMTKTKYDSEDYFQSMLARYPNLLAGDQIDSSNPRRWMLVSREVGIPDSEDGTNRWSLDHLFLDQDSIPTFVEVKRSTDNRIRREVVGQMLDYAANASVYWSVETIRAQFETTHNNSHQFIQDFLEEDTTEEEFWQQVKTNLRAGKIRLIFLADEIPIELKRIVEFLNGQMDPAEVLAVEIPQYTNGELRTLVPRIIGRTAEAEKKKSISVSKKQWDEQSFFEALKNHATPAEVTAATNLLLWVSPLVDDIYWGQGKKDGSFIPVLVHNGFRHQLFAVYTYNRIEIHFQYLKNKKPFDIKDKHIELQKKLNQIDGVSISNMSLSKRPSFKLKTLEDFNSFKKFTNIFEWVIQEIKNVAPK